MKPLRLHSDTIFSINSLTLGSAIESEAFFKRRRMSRRLDFWQRLKCGGTGDPAVPPLLKLTPSMIFQAAIHTTTCSGVLRVKPQLNRQSGLTRFDSL
jgi:hypothetical protein